MTLHLFIGIVLSYFAHFASGLREIGSIMENISGESDKKIIANISDCIFDLIHRYEGSSHLFNLDVPGWT